MTKRTRFRQQFQSLSLAFLLLNLISTIWAPIPVEEENSRLPPNIYKWIEENAHICTIVPSNGEELFNFLSVDEGLKCVLCPEHKPREVPSMACAVEVSPNDVDVEIGCHPIPELCVLELKNRYAEFYMGSPPGPEGPPGGPPGPPGSPPSGSNPPGQNGKRSEEEIFQATANVFSENPVINELAVTEINVDEEEEEEEEQIAMGTQKREEEEVKEVFDILHGRGDTTSTTTTTTISPTMEAVPLTTVQASVFSMPSGPLGVPINLTVSEASLHSRTAAPILGLHGPPGSEGGGEEFSSLEAGGIAIKEPMNMQKRVDGAEELELRGQKSSESCRDVHELCCFWALAGECDGNPFWMRVKCPMTCGTCGCRVKHADKCKSIGVKCVLPTSTTTTTMASSSPSSSSSSTASSLASSPEKSTPAGSTQPTPPPGQRRRTRPTPPARMPGHRPQRPKHQRTSPAGTSTSPQPMVAIKEELPLVKGDWNWKNAVEKGGNVPPGPPTSSYDEDQTEGGPSPPSSTAPPPPLFVVLSLSSAGYAEEEEKEGEKEAEDGGENGDDAFEQQQTVPVEPAQPITSESTSTEPAATTSRESCFNYHKLCDFWAKMGECSSNPFWMRPHCQRACLSCGETLGDISTPQPRPGGSLGSHFLPAESSPIPLTGCANEHILCPFWAFIGECGRNPRWMSLHCVASCQLC